MDVPKGFVSLGGKPMLAYSLEVLGTHPAVAQVVLVVPSDRLKETAAITAQLTLSVKVAVVSGGSERWESVRNGVNECSAAHDTILVHDAARPFVTHAVIDSLLEQSRSYRCVITATEVVDTIRQFIDDRALATVDRSCLIRVGTPQLFRRADLTQGFAQAVSMKSPPTDEAVLMQSMGIEVGIGRGDPANFKITSPSDMLLAEALLAWKATHR
jgi:2-C-methyl-D-erythritol 4-phosphate cytidylyltransferase